MTDIFLETLESIQRQLEFARQTYVYTQQQVPQVDIQVGELLKQPHALSKTLGQLLYEQGVISMEDWKEADKAQAVGAAKYGTSNWQSDFLSGLNLHTPLSHTEQTDTAEIKRDLREFFTMFHNAVLQADQLAATFIHTAPPPTIQALFGLIASLAVRRNQSRHLLKMHEIPK